MTTGCSPECVKYSNICDFCTYYEFHGNGYVKNGVIWRDAVYTEQGWCMLHQLKKSPEGSCNKFYCSNLPALKANKDWKYQKWIDEKYKAECKRSKYKLKIVKTKLKGKK